MHEPTHQNAALMEALKGYADKAYCDYIRQLQQTDCLGTEAKIASGKFGMRELEAHCNAARRLGVHKAIYEFIKDWSSRASPAPQTEESDLPPLPAASLAAILHEAFKDKERLDFLTEFGSTWHVQWEQRPGKAARYRMIDDGEACGKWHDNPRAAIDTAMKEQAK